ncbi:MAG: DUF469 family protein [Rhodocyclaceae bacterium]|nr:DUF469 family protein [Rhodocyclaceae bacterium]MCB1961868.1 DUF469 family protein [Rhodocyclaceae bacterium]
MAKSRSRRLRKKLCVGEFKEVGFDVDLQFPDDTAAEAVDAFFARFFSEVIEPEGLLYGGGETSGFVCVAGRGSVTDAQREAVQAWLAASGALRDFHVGPLVDAWFPTPVVAG